LKRKEDIIKGLQVAGTLDGRKACQLQLTYGATVRKKGLASIIEYIRELRLALRFIMDLRNSKIDQGQGCKRCEQSIDLGSQKGTTHADSCCRPPEREISKDPLVYHQC